ncbi:hypothetical protein VSDG_04295 [Cytospora chrysosperma]|uniref:Extracellular membrane protein CFEM domain-containing protein n=1 Tax=Cytospora chrysosperma TaxID=252740 RepID=A0A423W5J9_CYTCH|nr:hypothetical protein VSDG_04295 [Valsa sordida]
MKCTPLLALAMCTIATSAAVDSPANIAQRSCTSDCVAEGRPLTLCASLCSKRGVDFGLEVVKRASCFSECVASGKPPTLCASTCS